MLGRQHGRAHPLFGEFPIRHPQIDFGSIIFFFLESGFYLNLQSHKFRFHMTFIQGTKSPSLSGWPRQGDIEAHLDSANFWATNKNASHLCDTRHVGWEPEGTVSFTNSGHQQENTAAPWDSCHTRSYPERCNTQEDFATFSIGDGFPPGS